MCALNKLIVDCVLGLLAKIGSPFLDEFVALLLFHGSDAALATGLSLLRAVCVELIRELPSLVDERLPDRQMTSGSGRTQGIDRHRMQQIIYSMQEDCLPLRC